MSQDDPTWTARLSAKDKEYLQKKLRLTAGYCLSQYAKILRSQELPNALRELQEMKDAVSQKEALVTQLQQTCNTKQGVCNTAKSVSDEELCVMALSKMKNPSAKLDQKLNGILVTKELLAKAESYQGGDDDAR